MDLFVGLVFASVFTLLFAGLSLPRRRPVKKRLARLADGSRAVVSARRSRSRTSRVTSSRRPIRRAESGFTSPFVIVTV